MSILFMGTTEQRIRKEKELERKIKKGETKLDCKENVVVEIISDEDGWSATLMKCGTPLVPYSFEKVFCKKCKLSTN